MLALAVVAGFGPAAAQQSEVPIACRGDVEKFCAGAKPGSIIPCLTALPDQLSERCRAMVAGAPPTPEQDYRACQGEVRLFCQSVEPGEGRIRECLRLRAAELSAQCRVYQARIKD